MITARPVVGRHLRYVCKTNAWRYRKMPSLHWPATSNVVQLGQKICNQLQIPILDYGGAPRKTHDALGRTRA
jgi:hypothetical protein